MAPKKPARAGRNPRPSALVRAEHGGAEVSLTPAQRTILADVLREGEDFREEVESAVLRYGRSLLDKVFGGDTSAALAGNFGWAPPPLGRKEPTGSPSRLKGPWGDFWGRRYIG